MEFIGLPTSLRTSTEWLMASAAARGTWLALYFYCATQENAGVIPSCRSWSPILWVKACDAEHALLHEDCGLWWWEDDDLHVRFYDVVTEQNVRNGRFLKKNAAEMGRKGGSSTSPAKLAAVQQNLEKANEMRKAASKAASKADTDETCKAEGKGREGKGGEGDEENTAAPASSIRIENERVDTDEAVRMLHPTFGLPADSAPSSAVMAAACQAFPQGVAKSDLEAVCAFYAAEPTFDSPQAFAALDRKDPRSSRKWRLKSLLDEWPEQVKLAKTFLADQRIGSAKKETRAVLDDCLRHELEMLPRYDWRAVVRRIAPEHGWGADVLAALDDTNWIDLTVEHRQIIHNARPL